MRREIKERFLKSLEAHMGINWERKRGKEFVLSREEGMQKGTEKQHSWA